LLYAPLATQRRYLLGIPAPLAALAVHWLATDAMPRLVRWNRRRARGVLAAYGALATHTTLALLVWLVLAAGSPANADLFTPDSDSAAWAWIRQQTPTESVVLAGFKSGGAIAGRTGRRSIVGHWYETIDYPKKREAVGRFLRGDFR
jgi:hypothetical protein